MTVRIWATARHSLFEISQQLRRLQVTHSIRSQRGPARKINLGFAQPCQVFLSDDIEVWRPQAVNFISAATAELATTNFMPFPDSDLKTALIQMLTSEQTVVPVVLEMDAQDYVKQLVAPSALDGLQTEIYRIQPYDLRKRTQLLVLNYLNGKGSQSSVLRELRASLRTERLIPLVKPLGPLRDAVSRARTEPVEEVAAATGFSAFELRYLLKAKRDPIT